MPADATHKNVLLGFASCLYLIISTPPPEKNRVRTKKVIRTFFPSLGENRTPERTNAIAGISSLSGVWLQ
jgi:hypothetical protein